MRDTLAHGLPCKRRLSKAKCTINIRSDTSASERDNPPIHTGFTWHTEKCTRMCVDPSCLAAPPVYLYVISGKRSDNDQIRNSRTPHLAICVRSVLIPPVKKDVCLMEVSSLHAFAVSGIKRGRKHITYRQIVHQWPLRVFPVMG